MFAWSLLSIFLKLTWNPHLYLTRKLKWPRNLQILFCARWELNGNIMMFLFCCVGLHLGYSQMCVTWNLGKHFPAFILCILVGILIRFFSLMRNFNHETFKEMIFQVKVILDIKKQAFFAFNLASKFSNRYKYRMRQ